MALVIGEIAVVCSVVRNNVIKAIFGILLKSLAVHVEVVAKNNIVSFLCACHGSFGFVVANIKSVFELAR
jgi:hypothetical protein